MKSIDIKKLYSIHSWVGLITGILLFVIAFTGAVSVFGRPELKIWANPDIRNEIVIDAQRIDRLIAKYAQQLPKEFHEEVLVFLPAARTYPNLTVVFEDHDAEQAVLLSFDNNSLALLDRREGSPREVFAERKRDIADFIVDFHADLHLGRPVGLLLTGLLGLTLLASIITGFIIHRQKLKQLFTFRFKKASGVTLADSHKLFGVWGLMFNGVIAFTGAFLGLATVLLVPAAAFVSFGGDQDKLFETFSTAPEPVLSQEYQPTKLAPVLEHAFNYDPNMTLEVITIYGYSDRNAIVYVNGIGSEKVARQLMAYSGSTGEFMESFGQFGKVGGFSSQVLDLMFPLHFGNFGGAAVKLLWTILGLSTALLPLSGMMMWIERGQRAHSPKFSTKVYERFNRLVIGACGGIVLACAILFPTQLVLNKLPSSINTGFAIGIVFFSIWAISILWAYVARSAKQGGTLICYGIGTLMILTPPLNTVLTGDNLLSTFANSQWETFCTDLTLLGLGVAICYFTYKLSQTTEVGGDILTGGPHATNVRS